MGCGKSPGATPRLERDRKVGEGFVEHGVGWVAGGYLISSGQASVGRGTSVPDF